MSKFLKSAAAFCVVTALTVPVLAGGLGLGTKATPEQVKGWDIDVRPDGKGLPEGKGSVAKGEEIFAERCASCHGDFGEGVDRWPVLAGGQDTLASDRPVKTIGSYWPYLSTVWDYINRAMPFGEAQTLKPDEVYAITAYLLHMNDIVDEDFVLTKKNFSTIKLPNEKNFVMDKRPDIPVVTKKAPCMKDCKKKVEITKRAAIIDVTPEGETPSISVE